MKRTTRFTLPFLTCLCCAAAFVGCSSGNVIDRVKSPIAEVFKPKEEPPKPSIPIREIICIWQYAEGRDSKGSPSRGLAGRIMFFAQGSRTPVKIDDESNVFVYLFDDQGTPAEQAKPFHRIRFIENVWNKHLTDGPLGPTYQVFIPYERDIVHQVKCTVNVRLLTDDRPPVSSEMNTITLFGPVKDDAAASLVHSFEPGKNPNKTNVSSFGTKSKEDAFANLGNKILSAKRDPNAAPSEDNESIAAFARRRMKEASQQNQFNGGIRQTAGQQPDPKFGGAATPRANPLPGNGIQLRSAAPTFPQVQPRHPNVSSNPFDNPTPHETGHPLQDQSGRFSTARQPFSQTRPQQHPLGNRPPASRSLMPQEAAWNAHDDFDAPQTHAPRSFDDRRAALTTGNGLGPTVNRHPMLGNNPPQTGGYRAGHPLQSNVQNTAPTQHPLAEGFGDPRSFR